MGARMSVAMRYSSPSSKRIAGDAPVGQFFAEFYNVVVETTAGNIPTKTPYYRVLAAEGTLTHDTTSRTIVVDEVIPDPRGSKSLVSPVSILWRRAWFSTSWLIP